MRDEFDKLLMTTVVFQFPCPNRMDSFIDQLFLDDRPFLRRMTLRIGLQGHSQKGILETMDEDTQSTLTGIHKLAACDLLH